MRYSPPSETERAPAPVRVLLIDDGTTPHEERRELDAKHGFLVQRVTDWPAFVATLEDADYDVAIIDVHSHGAHAERIPHALKGAHPHRPVIMLASEEVSPRASERTAADVDCCLSHAVKDQLAGAIATCLAHAAREATRSLLERERTEATIRRSEARATFLVRLSDATRPLEKPEEIAAVTMRLLREALGADRCVYADVEPDGLHFSITAAAYAPGVPPVQERLAVEAAPGPLAAMRSGKPFVLHDAERWTEQRDRETYRRVGLRAVIAVPLVKSGRFVAYAGVHMLSPREWAEDEVELVDLVAERLWESMERARVARALRESEAEFRGLFELSAVGVAQTDPASGRFLRVNRRFCEITGYDEGQLLGLTFQDITHPDDRDNNAAAIGSVLRGEAKRWDIEKRYLRPDGRVVWVHVSGQLLTDAQGQPHRLIANAVDVSDRKQAEQALLASRRQLQDVTDSAPVLLANCGADYRFKFVNRAYAERYGLQPRQLVGRHIADVIGAEAFAQLKAHADRALRGERREFEADIHYRRLGRQWIRCAYAPERDASGHVVGWVAAILDITDRKRAEEALREADRRKDEFLAVLGHELRNPLAPLRTGVELMKASYGKPELLQGLCAMMERQLGHLIHLVNDLLDLARISRGDIELQRGRLDLLDVIDRALELSRPSIMERRHRLVLQHAEAPLTVEGDSQRLTQVVANLLSNAAKYTAPGGTITLSTDVRDGRACVRVIDTGYGIPAERLESVFDMFSQVPEHRARTGGGGLGIGLALSRQLVLLHGGTIEARSEGLGRGSEFLVCLPLSAAPAGTPAVRGPEKVTVARRRVLVVDDNQDAAESMRRLLEVHGHEAFAVDSGDAALLAVKELQPHVVMLDIGLPELDGYEVARRIRAESGGDQIMLVAVTGWAQEEDRRRASEAGFDEHLAKPIDMAQLTPLLDPSRRRAARHLE